MNADRETARWEDREKTCPPPAPVFPRLRLIQKTPSISFPLFGSWMITFLPSILLGVIFKTSPALIPPLAMSSSIRRFLGLSVQKMISSTTSFSRTFQLITFWALNIFFRIGDSQGFLSSGKKDCLMKLKKAERRLYLSFLVDCFVPSDVFMRKGNILSVVMDVSFMLPKWVSNFLISSGSFSKCFLWNSSYDSQKKFVASISSIMYLLSWLAKIN